MPRFQAAVVLLLVIAGFVALYLLWRKHLSGQGPPKQATQEFQRGQKLAQTAAKFQQTFRLVAESGKDDGEWVVDAASGYLCLGVPDGGKSRKRVTFKVPQQPPAGLFGAATGRFPLYAAVSVANEPPKADQFGPDAVLRVEANTGFLTIGPLALGDPRCAWTFSLHSKHLPEGPTQDLMGLWVDAIPKSGDQPVASVQAVVDARHPEWGSRLSAVPVASANQPAAFWAMW